MSYFDPALTIILILYLQLAVTFAIPCCDCTYFDDSDAKILLDWKTNLTDPYGNLDGWGENRTCASWHGVCCNNSTRVVSLNLSKKSLTGSIPSSLGNLTKLESLLLFDNLLMGRIPSSLGALLNLEYLAAANNSLEGSIPLSLGNLTALYTLDFGQNSLNGSIPSTLGSLMNLGTLNLSSNFLSGPIPSSLGNLTDLLYLDLSDNKLSGSIPTSLGKLTGLKYLDLGSNFVSGTVPATLDSLCNSSAVILSGNCFPLGSSSNRSGCHVIGTRSTVQCRQYCNASQSGGPCGGHGSCTADQKANKSSCICSAGFSNLRDTFTCQKILSSPATRPPVSALSPQPRMAPPLSRVLGSNPPPRPSTKPPLVLSATPHLPPAPPSPYQPPAASLQPLSPSPPPPIAATGKTTEVYVIIVAISTFLAIPVLIVCSFCVKTYCGRLFSRETTLDKQLKRYYMRRVSFSEVMAATNGFSSANIMGMGDHGTVFKGVAQNGEMWAVKRGTDSSPEATNAFHKEVEVMCQLSHSNILTLNAYCSDRGEQILIYDFMPNGSLKKRLRCKRGEEPLTLEQRVNIAIGVASGLSYLHQLTIPCTSHKNFTTDKILLDENLNPLLATFELVKGNVEPPFEDIGSPTSSYCLSSTGNYQLVIDYVDPNFFRSVEDLKKDDVLSFGVILLELITGLPSIVRGVGTSAVMSESLVTHVSEKLGWNLSKMVDPLLGNDYEEEAMIAFIGIAKHCVNHWGSQRPSMKEARDALVDIGEKLTLAKRLQNLPLGYTMEFPIRNSSFSSGGPTPSIGQFEER